MIRHREILLGGVLDVGDLCGELATKGMVDLGLVTMRHRDVKVCVRRLVHLEARAIRREEVVLDRRTLRAALALRLQHDGAHIGAPADALDGAARVGIDFIVAEDGVDAIDLRVPLAERAWVVDSTAATAATTGAVASIAFATFAKEVAAAAVVEAFAATLAFAEPLATAWTSPSTIVPAPVAEATKACVAGVAAAATTAVSAAARLSASATLGVHGRRRASGEHEGSCRYDPLAGPSLIYRCRKWRALSREALRLQGAKISREREAEYSGFRAGRGKAPSSFRARNEQGRTHVTYRAP